MIPPPDRNIEIHMDESKPSIRKMFPRVTSTEAPAYELKTASIDPLHASLVRVKFENFAALQNRQPDNGFTDYFRESRTPFKMQGFPEVAESPECQADVEETDVLSISGSSWHLLSFSPSLLTGDFKGK